MFYNLYLIILLVILTQTSARTQNKWVDPHSLDGNIYYKDECNCETTDVPKEIILSHYQRTLNLLLNSLNYNPERGSYKGRPTIDLPADEYNFIKGFSDRGVINTEEWNKLDGILTRIYTKSRTDEYADIFMSWREMFVFYVYCKEALVLTGVLVCLVFVYNLLNAKIRTWTVAKYLLLVLYLVDFGFVWIRLLQEQEVQKMVNSLKYKSMPAECDPNKMGFFQFLKHTFSDTNDKCREYHSTMFADDLWKVNPLKVFGTQLGDLIQTPANAFGTAFGQFTSAIIGNMSWYMAPLMPIIFIFILLMICILLSFLTKTSFGFNFLYLIQFNFGKEGREKVDDVISGKHLKTIMKFVQNKPAIQEIHVIGKDNVLMGKPVLSSIEDVPSDYEADERIKSDERYVKAKITSDERSVKAEIPADEKYVKVEGTDNKIRSDKKNVKFVDDAITSDKQRGKIENLFEDSFNDDVFYKKGILKNKSSDDELKKTDFSNSVDKEAKIETDKASKDYKTMPIIINKEQNHEIINKETNDNINKDTEIENEFRDDDISATCSDDDIEVIEECSDEECKCRSRGRNVEIKPSGGGDYF